MSTATTENAFEAAVVRSLVRDGGYTEGDSRSFSRDLAFNKGAVLAFLQTTQPQAWEKLVSIHGDGASGKLTQRLFKELDNRGMLDVLRHGIVDYGVRFRLAYFKPASGLNPETIELYRQNVLTVTRQLHYSAKEARKSVDLLLSLNGLPVATLELKNQFTGQDVSNARRQYSQDRDPRELLFQFKKRALVHFAVDTDEVSMTTRMDGDKTRYLPFNRGHGRGAGNPPNQHGHRTAYLWEEVLAKESWLDIIGKFLHLEKKELTVDGRSLRRESLIFPRYHQLDVVRKLSADAEKRGAGQSYLVQHSAGSGKSNSIAWLAYRLSSLYNTEDKRVFDSVVVITDRRVLDKQLQDTIYQFEHKQGVVQRIDKDAGQLAEALKAGTSIIITTLQKFPFVLDKVEELGDKRYAVIVDEAHSSQGGEASKSLKEVLGDADVAGVADNAETYDAGADDAEDDIRASMQARGKQANLSFFAFTATPKPKTLEAFGEVNAEGKPEPFHLYSMRQAIEEGFIMDVLQNYTTYKNYYRLSKQIEDDPQLNKKKAARAIARRVSFMPGVLAQKMEIIIEHFRQCVMHKIGGKAKAMVVTSSRPHVVRYKKAFDEYLKEKSYTDIRALVAFTAFTDKDTGLPYSEFDLNGFGERELPGRFASDEYQLLLVADKYQTGFDQPLLHTMYVDKKLSGVRAVQTLSRLNRTYPGKEDTFVIDFKNEEEEILAAFQPFYEKTTLSAQTDPNKLYDLKADLETYQVIREAAVDAFARVFFAAHKAGSLRDHQRLNAHIDPAVDRFKALGDNEKRDDFKNALTVYVRLYAFLAQIMPFKDVELEKFYAYVRFLASKLPQRGSAEGFELNDEVALEYYRLQKISEGNLDLKKDSEASLNPLSEAGDREEKDDEAKLSEIINILNDRFGTDFTQADKYFFDQIEEELIQDETLAQQARNNTIGNFKYGLDEAFVTKLIERMDMNQDIFAKIMDNREFNDAVKEYMLHKVYKRFNESSD